jgi:undecaprenyl pyrophosphate synthase
MTKSPNAVHAFLRRAANKGKAARRSHRSAPGCLPSALPDPDLIIRTSGENKLSGFLLWQSAYSEQLLHRRQLAGVPQSGRAFQQRKRRFAGCP